MVVDEQRPQYRFVKRCTLRNPKGKQKLGKIRNVHSDVWVVCLTYVGGVGAHQAQAGNIRSQYLVVEGAEREDGRLQGPRQAKGK